MGVSVSTARSGNVIGGGDFAANRLIPDCARALANREVIKIRNPKAVRPYLHVLDSLRAYLDIAQKQYEDISFASAYNVGPDEANCATSSQLADYFCNAWGEGSKWEHISVENPHESGLLKLDCSKIKEKLGWLPQWNIEQAVCETVAWYKAFYNGDDTTAVMVRQISELF
jgi:CDP-glucose 4,6-dehydratase